MLKKNSKNSKATFFSSGLIGIFKRMEAKHLWPQPQPRIPFDTVATFNDKKNNNNVTVNIALKPLLSKPKNTVVKPEQNKPEENEPQPAHLRVDKATITDPIENEEESGQKMKQKPVGRFHSVLQSLKSVFFWTTHSISGGMKNSESFILDNGKCVP